ncbi:glycine cleavage system protein H [Mesomycoplasma bovoculi]|uniref:Glycine cleavage system H protein n=1 Tax=Mesomycoplasma bovoculi M165/69 TaxID=743966 RepID=W5UT42_9BACT|nr:glycine cleavage system protein H [Mesomycoplasma bovoculi]AHH45307.1 glycine cleavage system H protein [Mesomycoplasma bovoculi M165/69]
MKKFANFLIIEKTENIVTISMSAELQDDVGTIGFLRFTNAKSLSKNDEILKIEASKTVLSIKTPLAGEIVEINQEAITTPRLLNSADARQNWIIKLTKVDENEFNSLPNF